MEVKKPADDQLVSPFLLTVGGGSKSTSSHRKKTRSKLLYFWSSEDVIKWLRKHCTEYYNMYKDIFAEHDINGRSLVRLNDIKLQRMGVEDRTHREEIIRHILKMKMQTESRELKNLDQKKGIGFYIIHAGQ